MLQPLLLDQQFLLQQGNPVALAGQLPRKGAQLILQDFNFSLLVDQILKLAFLILGP